MEVKDDLAEREMGVRHRKDFPTANRKSVWDRDTNKRTSSVQENLVSRVIVGTDSPRS